MESAVLLKLQEVSSVDANVRIAAELALLEVRAAPEFPQSLITIIASTDKYAAAICLKSYVETNWSPSSAKYVADAPCPAEVKEAVRTSIIPCLSDPSSGVRSAVAFAISKIARHDWPEQWPTLLPNLLQLITDQPLEMPGVHGALSVLNEFVQSEVGEEQFVGLAGTLSPILHAVVTRPCPITPLSMAARVSAIETYGGLVEAAQMISENLPDAVKAFIAPDQLDPWMSTFVTFLQDPSCLPLAAAATRVLSILLAGFGKRMASSIPHLLPILWQRLADLQAAYVSLHITGDGGDTAEGEDVLLSFLFAAFDFIIAAARRKSGREFFLGHASASGETAIVSSLPVILCYIRITQEQEMAWNEDANAFVADEEEDSYSSSIRNAATDVLLVLIERFTAPALQALGAASSSLLAASRASKATDPEWWRVDESVLHAIGRSADWLMGLLKERKTEGPEGMSNEILDLAGLFDHVILVHMQSQDLPFLQGRALLLASEYAAVLPPALIQQYVEAAITALTAPTISIPVRVSALRTIHNFSRQFQGENALSATHREAMLSGIVSLVGVTQEDSLILVLESLLSTLQIQGEISDVWTEQLTSTVILPVWQKYPTDHILASLVMDIFDAIAMKGGNTYVILRQLSLPVLVGVLKGYQAGATMEESAIVSSAVDLLTSLTKSGESPLPAGYIAALLPYLLHVLSVTEDRDIMQSGQQCLKLLVSKDFDQLAQWRADGGGQSGAECLMQIIRQAAATENESAAFFIGDLAAQIVVQDHPAVAAILPGLLYTLLALIAAAETSTFTQSLVLVFAQIIERRDTGEMLDFLQGQRLPDGRDGITVLMTTWLENYPFFQGYYPMKLSAHALAKLYLLNDPRVMSMLVKGDLVPAAGSGRKIQTRSRSKTEPEQYTSIPAEVKIVKLLLGEWSNDVEAAYGKRAISGLGGDEGSEEDEDEEDEWDDVDESPFAPAEDFQYLSDYLTKGGDFGDMEDEEDEEDPSILNDPIYKADLQVFLKEFFQQATVAGERASRVTGQLKEEEVETLRTALGA